LSLLSLPPQVSVEAPDQKGRLEILKVHGRNKKFEDDLDLKEIALRTPGFSGGLSAVYSVNAGVAVSWCRQRAALLGVQCVR
jgi:ATP-dependent Zn protease